MKRLFYLCTMVFVLSIVCSSCNNGSDSIYGVWKEYRADDPSNDYLISQLRFNQNGTGSFVLLDGGTVRSKSEFTWEMDSFGNITVYYNTSGSVSTYKFNNGLVTENSALGTIVYRKKELF